MGVVVALDNSSKSLSLNRVLPCPNALALNVPDN
jgi:hypothetical protein